eukprot:COSAG04_NODE_30626_length_261_cov_0.962963_2_plen_61_part_01
MFIDGCNEKSFRSLTSRSFDVTPTRAHEHRPFRDLERLFFVAADARTIVDSIAQRCRRPRN